MKILYFTASGNSLYVAKSFGGELYSIPKMIKEETYEFTDEKIGIVFPLYEWSVPPYVADFLKKAKFNCDYLFAVFTYGIYDGALTTHLESIADEAGYRFNYINRIKMVDNWLPGFKMEREIKNEHKKEIEKHLEAIKSDVENSKEFKVKDSIINKIGTNYMVNRPHKSPHKKFTVEDSCTQCGVCTKVCPKDNIRKNDENGKVSVNDDCMSCFACTHNCPSNAIRFRGERSKSRFRNSNVKLAEIIEANS